MELKPSWSCVQFLGATNVAHTVLFWIQFNLSKCCLIWLQASDFQIEEKIQRTCFGMMGANVVSLDSTERRLNSQKKQFERLHGMAWTFTSHWLVPKTLMGLLETSLVMVVQKTPPRPCRLLTLPLDAFVNLYCWRQHALETHGPENPSFSRPSFHSTPRCYLSLQATNSSSFLQKQGWLAWHNSTSGGTMAFPSWQQPTALYLEVSSTQPEENHGLCRKPSQTPEVCEIRILEKSILLLFY